MKKLPLAILTVLLLCGPSAAADDAKAVFGLVQGVVDRALAVLRDEKVPLDAKKEMVVDIINPLVDLPLAAKLTLGPKQWPRLGEKQRREFTDLFVDQVKSSYFEKMDQFSDAKVEFEAPVAKEDKFYMLTHVIGKDQRLKLAYKLYRSSESWKIYDLEIEGVSIVKSYGAQYKEFLQKGTFEELLEKMREKAQSAKKSSKSKKSPDEKAVSPEAEGSIPAAQAPVEAEGVSPEAKDAALNEPDPAGGDPSVKEQPQVRNPPPAKSSPQAE
ncbi:MAG: ABC transporter substrate-binding protein [Elusimicrobia bacterium]|nr:ABC transporter substrate-binding protein [Elusimicrobiota bacterium]